MFIGYLRKEFDDAIEALAKTNALMDAELLKHTYNAYPEYCFAAYEGKEIVGVISGYRFEKSVFVNIFEVNEQYQGIDKRLLALFLKNTMNLDVVLLLESEKFKTLDEFGLKEHSRFYRFMYSGEAVAFNFSNTHAKQVAASNYDEISKDIDKSVFSEDRQEYLGKDLVFANSLKLGTQSGFLHSYVVNKKYIKISPWLMKSEAFLDAEKLLRAVLYYRGLKKIYAYAPDVKEIVDLYENYKFKKDGNYKLVYLNAQPEIKLENMYAI